MPTQTSRLKLLKPASGEAADAGRENYNANMDTLDQRPGVFICTSTTRPASPYEGQVLYETDTKELVVRTNDAWEYINSQPYKAKPVLWGTFSASDRVRVIGTNSVITPSSGVYSVPLPSYVKSVLSVTALSGDENNAHTFILIASNPVIASGIRFVGYTSGNATRLTVTSRIHWSAVVSY